MPTKELVTKVWIEEGCIVCDACETTAPDVFEVLDDTCIIRPAALEMSFTKPRTDDIIDAAEECPVDVIKFDTVEEEVSEEAAAASSGGGTEDSADAQPESKPAAPKPAAEAKPAAEKASPEKSSSGKDKAVAASVAGAPDPAMAALLRAATARGGNVGIMSGAGGSRETSEWDRKDPSELPPDARQAKVMQAAKKISEDPDMGRRAFAGLTLGIGWFAFGTGVAISVGPAFGRYLMPNVLEEPDPRVRVGPLKKYIEMPPGGVNEDYKPQGIWMVREEDRVAALSIICTHLGCIPNWLPNDRKFKCPCHGSGYYYDGINFEGPTPRPLERFRVTIEAGVVVVDKSKKYQYELGQWDQPGSYLAV